MLQAIGRSSARSSGLLSARIPVLLQAVRGRKSRTDPKAKSKEERIKMPPPVDPVEMVVLRERNREYQLIFSALRFDFYEEVVRKKFEMERGSQAAEKIRQETEEHRALMAWNDQENKRLLQKRILRIQREKEEAQLKEWEEAVQREQKQQEFIKEKEMELMQLQEEVKNFITLENLDERIEDALDNPTNYNFAVSKLGRVVKRTKLQ